MTFVMFCIVCYAPFTALKLVHNGERTKQDILNYINIYKVLNISAGKMCKNGQLSSQRNYMFFATKLLIVTQILMIELFHISHSFCLIGNPSWTGKPTVVPVNQTESNSTNTGKRNLSNILKFKVLIYIYII